MNAHAAHALKERVDALTAHGAYHRLVLLVGPARSGKTFALREFASETGWPRLNLNLALAERLLDVPSRFRQIRVLDLLRDLADAAPGDGLVLDNTELLFQRSLQVDPIQALLALSRSRVVVASWCGEYTASVLTYAMPGHAEYRHYPEPGCTILPIGADGIRPSTRASKGSLA
jgi:hypothetical protein